MVSQTCDFQGVTGMRIDDCGLMELLCRTEDTDGGTKSTE